MSQRNEIGYGYLGTLAWMVLLFVLTISLPDKAAHLRHTPSHSPAKVEMSMAATKAISAEAVVIPSAQNSCLTLVTVPVYSFYSNTLKVANDNWLMLNKLTILHQQAQRLRPFLLEGWKPFLRLTRPTEDPSILG